MQFAFELEVVTYGVSQELEDELTQTPHLGRNFAVSLGMWRILAAWYEAWRCT